MFTACIHLRFVVWSMVGNLYAPLAPKGLSMAGIGWLEAASSSWAPRHNRPEASVGYWLMIFFRVFTTMYVHIYIYHYHMYICIYMYTRYGDYHSPFIIVHESTLKNHSWDFPIGMLQFRTLTDGTVKTVFDDSTGISSQAPAQCRSIIKNGGQNCDLAVDRWTFPARNHRLSIKNWSKKGTCAVGTSSRTKHVPIVQDWGKNTIIFWQSCVGHFCV